MPRLLTRRAFTLGAAVSLTGCDHGVLWQDDRYAAYWIDARSQVALGLKLESGFLGRVAPQVVAAGSNDQFVLAERRAGKERSFHLIDKSRDNAARDSQDVTFVASSLADLRDLAPDLPQLRTL